MHQFYAFISPPLELSHIFSLTYFVHLHVLLVFSFVLFSTYLFCIFILTHLEHSHVFSTYFIHPHDSFLMYLVCSHIFISTYLLYVIILMYLVHPHVFISMYFLVFYRRPSSYVFTFQRIYFQYVSFFVSDSQPTFIHHSTIQQNKPLLVLPMIQIITLLLFWSYS